MNPSLLHKIRRAQAAMSRGEDGMPDKMTDQELDLWARNFMNELGVVFSLGAAYDLNLAALVRDKVIEKVGLKTFGLALIGIIREGQRVAYDYYADFALVSKATARQIVQACHDAVRAYEGSADK